MSDERIDVVIKEASPDPGRRVWTRLWDWLKHNFPLVTRSGAAFARAKVSQEEAKAELLRARAEVESARAEAIRANTRLRLSALDSANQTFAAQVRSAEAPKEECVELERKLMLDLQRILLEARMKGIQISFEEVVEQRRLASGSVNEDEDQEF